ncbi:hypothetical protein PVAND_004693 [Polypedilum vanderplanki]|uniref:Uncharacterized protein n=1 Tax=Polypedilum vanderplanki TaxID=319348 RepID=A0A9J6BZV1_POLVA|nr:hypothetical protein PVAND_004693 [Polypedilum vanderplanki]
MNTVEVRNAVKYYGSGNDPFMILNKLNMTVPPGSIYALLGASGCGKTTLLSCILGMIPLDDGEISVFGNVTTKYATKVNGSRIGYMPQEMALVGELTVKETIYYFGKIFLMDIDKLRDRYDMLHKLLELPRGDQRIETCSGGQKRRVSFAAAMIHEPDLLILDEPTVGLDPLLREKIWSFMLDVTSTSKLSIIITTHYIEEARQAKCVGLMRNGVLLAEDKPMNIVNQNNVENLEEAFLALCLKRGVSEYAGALTYIETNGTNNNIYNTNNLEMNANRKHTSKYKNKNVFASVSTESRSNNLRWPIVKTLFIKVWTQLKRQPAALVLITFLPIIQLFFFYHACGGNPKGLQLAIVNNEIDDYETTCNRSTLISTYPHDYTCDLHLISCRFLDELTDETAIKVFFSSFDEAWKAAKRGEYIGIIEISRNFTEALEIVRKRPEEATEGIIQSSKIKVYLDQADLQLTFFLQRKIYEVYTNYTQNVLRDCKMPIKLDNIPMDFSESLFGSIDSDFKHTMMPAFTMLVVFVLSSGLTLSGIILERKEGFWNRTLLAGVSTIEILSAYIIINFIIVIMQLFEVLFLLTFIYGTYYHGSYMIVMMMLAILGCSGINFGLWISCLCSELMQANLLMSGITQPLTVLSGMIWPVEGMPIVLRIISYAMPTTIPSRAMREVIEKKYTLTHPNVLLAFGNLFAWFFITLYLGISAVKRSKYSRNT